MPVDAQQPADIDSLEVLVTAQEAFPALERLFLGAEREIWAGFRVFDLSTRLRGPQAREIGDDWMDLFRHTLERGVSITLVLSDFDPVLATEYHRKSWNSARQAALVEELCDAGNLTFRVAAHPARVGLLPRLIFRSKVHKKLRESDAGRHTPGLWDAKDRGALDMIPATHHQKLAVVDRTTLFIGGLDLDERRYDTQKHDRPAGETWHDVQLVVTGPVVAAAQDHLETFERMTEGRADPNTSGTANDPAFLRTLSARRAFNPFHISPRTVCNEIEQAHLDAIGRADGLLYFETQFFRHLPLARALARAGGRRRDLGLIMVLPAAPEDVAFNGNTGRDAQLGAHLQTECIDIVRESFGDRALFCAPAQKRAAAGNGDPSELADAPIIYVHAKVSIFGNREAIVSSANLNGRSLCWDTEAGVRLTTPEHVGLLRRRLFDHWMPGSHGEAAPDVVQAWRREAQANRDAEPEARRSFLLPFDCADARELAAPVPVVPDELV